MFDVLWTSFEFQVIICKSKFIFDIYLDPELLGKYDIFCFEF